MNKDVINEDAYYKLLAYSGQLEKQRREKREDTLADASIYAGFDNFDSFYTDTLVDDAKKPARAINPEVFRPKRFLDSDGSLDK
jgi:hypothetical protein